jgi:single-stranded-DNA-specific exonuclease
MLRYLGVKAKTRLPHRFSEGYGLSEKIVDEIDEGLVITVDNGIAAVEAIQKAKDKGLEVIIIDHHLRRDDGLLPPADIIIDPNAIEGSCEFTDYCGGGLAYKLAEKLIDDETYLKKLSCFAAIATVADVMPLLNENRKIVVDGMRNMVIPEYRTTGLGALMRAKRLEKCVTAKDIGFSIGPCINAAGRLLDDGAEKALHAVSFDGDEAMASVYADELNRLNESRKDIVKKEMLRVNEQIEEGAMFADSPIIIYLEGVGEGIVGILAGRVAEDYGVPCIVFTDSKIPGIIKGSGRSGGDVHLKNLLDETNAKMHEMTWNGEQMGIWKYGGHKGAAGISIRKDFLDTFYQVTQDLCPERTGFDPNTLYYDLEIEAKEIPQMFHEVQKYAPYGEGNPEIVFKIKNYELVPKEYGFAKTMGAEKQHIRFSSRECETTAFNLSEKFVLEEKPRKIDMIGVLALNTFGEVSMNVEAADFEKVEEKKKMTSLAQMLAEKAAARTAM